MLFYSTGTWSGAATPFCMILGPLNHFRTQNQAVMLISKKSTIIIGLQRQGERLQCDRSSQQSRSTYAKLNDIKYALMSELELLSGNVGPTEGRSKTMHASASHRQEMMAQGKPSLPRLNGPRTLAKWLRLTILNVIGIKSTHNAGSIDQLDAQHQTIEGKYVHVRYPPTVPIDTMAFSATLLPKAGRMMIALQAATTSSALMGTLWCFESFRMTVDPGRAPSRANAQHCLACVACRANMTPKPSTISKMVTP